CRRTSKCTSTSMPCSRTRQGTPMHARPSIIRIALLLALLTLLAVGCSSGPAAEAVEPTEEAPPTEIPVEPTPTRTPVPAEAVNVTPVSPAVAESVLVGIRTLCEL